jgi:tetratricopeptide (TPR) repeat protein
MWGAHSAALAQSPTADGNATAEQPPAGEPPAQNGDQPATDATQSSEDEPNPGLADLDEAMVKKIDAESMSDLQEVAALIESAIAKGLDEENQAFAKKMLGGILLQRGQAIVAEMLKGREAQGRLQQLRSEALRSFERAVESDPTLADAHLQIARLSMLPGGNPKRAFDAASAAIEKITDEPKKKSEALLLRAMMQDDTAARLEDLNAAIEADPENSRAYQARGLLRVQTGDFDAGLEDLKILLEKDPSNTEVAVAVADALIREDRRDEALQLLDTAITTQPSSPLYLLRSELRRLQGKTAEAQADLDRAISLDPNNPAALLLRAENKLRENRVEEAREDVDAAMALQPGNVRGVFLRSLIAAEQQRYTDAINDMKLLVRNDPENLTWALQLASYYQFDDRPRKAIEVASEILERDASQWQAYRVRGDAYLSINEHAKAIADYKSALEIPLASEEELEQNPSAMTKVSRSGLANNLAWVLATSPRDALRDGKLAIKWGTEAAELTEYKEAHILSTLAAAYAESGDFERAVQWAEKAVAAGEKADGEEPYDQLDQLRNELESYRQGKPWREAQDVEENEVPILSPDEVIDT